MRKMQRSALFPLGVLLTLGLASVASCSEEAPTPPPSTALPSGTVDSGGDSSAAMDALKADWKPRFDPDVNTLVANPDVQPASKDEADDVEVTPTQLIFSAAKHPEVIEWQPGRLVVSAPGAVGATGKNPLGFARRVVAVAQQGSLVVVDTVIPALEELFTGDLQQTFDPDKAVEVPLEQLDLDWAAQNLYQDADLISPGPDPLPDSYPTYPGDVDELGEPLPGQPGWGFVGSVAKGFGKAVGSAAKAVASVTVDAWVAITPASFTGSAKLGHEFKSSYNQQIFRVDAKKPINKGGKFPMELAIKGSGDVKADISFNPGVQVGMRVPVPGHGSSFATWLNVDSYFRSNVDLALALEASISSAGGDSGSALQKRLANDADFAQNVLNDARKRFLGDQDVKPAGGWKKTLYISRPSTQVIAAGPVPVALTETFQLDLECGFEAKASLNAKIRAEQAMTFKFGVRYDDGKFTSDKPVFTNLKNRSIQVTGGGEVSLTCGLIPRVNAFVYDSVGLNAGIRGSVVARAAYESKCPSPADPRRTTPNGKVEVGLYGNVGLQIGARVQTPGSSFAGKSGQKLGSDIGPIEPFNKEFEIWTKDWSVKGLGYCTPSCKDAGKSGDETDVDCGGACDRCGESKQCKVNGDCAVGFCANGRCSATDHCSDGIKDRDESAIDCGGALCKKCPAGRTCAAASDCASGFCKVNPGSGSSGGTCVADHCQDGVRDGGELGIDCGGGGCKKCALGVACADGAGCVSGFSNGYTCVANLCGDLQKSPGEADVDCGGSTCLRCGSGKSCATDADCSKVAPECGPTSKVCGAPGCANGMKDGTESGVDCGGQACPLRCAEGTGCALDSDCASGLVCDPNAKVCAKPNCNDGSKNGAETGVDCGGPVCAARCGAGVGCNVTGDCAGGLLCDAQTKLCTAPSCSDGLQNQGEADIDCGGPCAGCAVGQKCAAKADCASTFCVGNLCAVRDCTDNVKNGDETDVDCGGGCGKCAIGKACLVGADCTTNICTAGVCAQPPSVLAEWQFDNSCVDLSGNGHDCTLAGATYSPSAKSGSACLLTNNASATVNAFDFGDTFTIAGWGFIGAQTNTIQTFLGAGANGVAAAGFKLFVNGFGTNDGRVVFETGNGTAGCNWSAPPGTFPSNQWVHVAVTVNRVAGTAAIYINGALVTPTPGACVRTDFPTNNPMRIGAFSNTSFPWSGSIDHLIVYNRILSASEVSALVANP